MILHNINMWRIRLLFIICGFLFFSMRFQSIFLMNHYYVDPSKEGNYATTTTTALSSSSRDNDDRSNNNYFILHVGPEKTGTTTLQCTLKELENNGILPSHRFHVLEIQSCRHTDKQIQNLERNLTIIKKSTKATYDNVLAGASWIPGCFFEFNRSAADEYTNRFAANDSKVSPMPDCWHESYERVMTELRENDRKTSSSSSVIVSNENMMVFINRRMEYGTRFLDTFTQSLQHIGNYHLVVIATYRRYFEWLHSEYKQTLNGNVNREETNEKGWPRAKPSESKEGEKQIIPSFLQEKKQFTRLGHAHSITQVLKFFRDHPNVTLHIINMHSQDTTLEQEFFCNGFPNDTSLYKTLCTSSNQNKSSVINNQFGEKKSNARNYLSSYAELALSAYWEGLIPTKISKKSVIAAMKYFQEEKLKLKEMDFYVCPTEKEYQRLLQYSLSHEREMLPHILNPIHLTEKEHIKVFEEAKMKMCHLDTNAVLNDPAWINFFKNISEEVLSF